MQLQNKASTVRTPTRRKRIDESDAQQNIPQSKQRMDSSKLVMHGLHTIQVYIKTHHVGLVVVSADTKT